MRAEPVRSYLLPIAMVALALVLAFGALAPGADLGCMTDTECEALFGPEPDEDWPASDLPPALTE